MSCPCDRGQPLGCSLTWLCTESSCLRARLDDGGCKVDPYGDGGARALRSSRGPWRPGGSYSARRLVPGTSERTGACAPAKRAVAKLYGFNERIPLSPVTDTHHLPLAASCCCCCYQYRCLHLRPRHEPSAHLPSRERNTATDTADTRTRHTDAAATALAAAASCCCCCC